MIKFIEFLVRYGYDISPYVYPCKPLSYYDYEKIQKRIIKLLMEHDDYILPELEEDYPELFEVIDF